MAIILTESLAKRIRELQEGNPASILRIAVRGGGCQGFNYFMEMTEEREDGDTIFEKDGVCVVIDDISLPLLEGAEIDFVDDLIGASIKIKNPNASSSCGCGTSFSL